MINMKRFLILTVTALLIIAVFAQTNEEIETWAQKGIAALKSGDYQEAILYFESIKASFEKTTPKDKVYGDILSDLSNCYTKLSEYAKAVEYGTKALEIRRIALGENHPDYAISLSLLAQYYNLLGDYSKAVEYEKNIRYIPTCSSALGDYSKAVEYETKVAHLHNPVSVLT